ncbi:MAG: O-antigen ligase family protein, partial [Planctomycetota bacterium]
MIALVRAMVLFEPLPGWDTSPLNNVSAILGFGPTACLMLDAIACLASAVLCWLLGSRLALAGLLSLLGAAAVATHTVLFERGNAEPLAIAGAWTSGGAMLAAASVSASRPALRRAGLAVLAGFLCILLAKGAGQLLVEHPSVVRTFESDPEGALAARGYAPGSAPAMQFERRLRQPDVTGWFGLANVVAAYLAAGAVSFGFLAFQSRRCLSSWAWWSCTALVALCWVGIVATGSKAGLAVAASGLVTVAAVRLILTLGRSGWWSRRAVLVLGLGVWTLPVLAIAGRAVLLPHEGELSLLFRYFYIDTAIDIAKNNLLRGTGIDGFRAAYAVAKPPIAPESVTSSHNALTDWLAMLGMFGLSLAVAAVVAAWSISGSLATRSRPCSRPAHTSRPTVLCIGGMLALPVVTSAAVESAGALIELAVLRLIGLAAGVAVAAAVWNLRPTRAACAAFGLVLLAHTQLDMVLFHPGSIPLAMLAIGLALPTPRASRWRARAAVLPLLCGAALATTAWSAWQWEGPLRRAFDAGQQIAEIGERARSGSDTARAEFPAVVATATPIVRAGLEEAAEAM